MTPVPPRTVVRRTGSLYGYDRTVERLGLAPVAGADEAGRGACAGPLVVAAVVLPLRRGAEIDELADSKLISAATRERVMARVQAVAVSVSVVVVPAPEVDRHGVHKANLEAMRRAVARLDVRPGYVLTDGFPVAGIGSPGLGVWKGDRVSANVAAASVVAKVTRDAMLADLDEQYPGYGFAEHKGYSTPEHQQALSHLGPCQQHRYSYANVSRVALKETG
ncbi:MAG: ribonuclease HII [Jiangellales bacterium]